MIKFNELHSFYNPTLRDNYNAESHRKKVIHINPKYIVALERVEVGGVSVFPSSYDATRVHTVHGHWVVEGCIETISQLIGHSKG